MFEACFLLEFAGDLASVEAATTGLPIAREAGVIRSASPETSLHSSLQEAARRSLSAIQCDCFRQCGSYSWRSVIEQGLLSRTFRPILTMRLYQALGSLPRALRGGLKPVVSVAHRLMCHWAAIDLPKTARIGRGFTLTHGWGAVIDGDALIGRNVTIFHGVTIGQVDRPGPNGEHQSLHAAIGDNVWIGPNAAVLGGVSIGVGARILAGAVVTSCVPAHAVVAGNPGRIVMRDAPEDVWNRVPDYLLYGAEGESEV